MKLDPDEMCREAAKAGAHGIDLVGPEFFPSLQKYGLIPTMVPGGSGIKAGINDPKHHAEIEPKMRAALKDAAAAKAPNVIVLAGDRAGISDEQGLDTCVAFLNRVKAQAEDLGVTLCMELLNSKVNHPDYMCDHTAWGVEMCKRVGSPRVKLLYDIYHMQIMEGDIIRTINRTSPSSATSTRPAIPAAMNSMSPRNSTIPPSAGPLRHGLPRLHLTRIHADQGRARDTRKNDATVRGLIGRSEAIGTRWQRDLQAHFSSEDDQRWSTEYPHQVWTARPR